MTDFELTLDDGESLRIFAYQGKAKKQMVKVFIWQKNEDRISVSIEVEGIEKKVLEITDRGDDIKVIDKNNG